MKKWLLALILFTNQGYAQDILSDDVKAILVKESIASYQGICPCPYTLDQTGKPCNGNSAWSRSGGASPYCYFDDIPEAILFQFLNNRMIPR